MNISEDRNGLNEYETSYIKERISGKQPTQAFKDSKYQWNGSEKNIRQAAHKIEHRDRVQAEIQRIKEMTAQRQALTREELAAYILEIIMDPETGNTIKQKYLKLYSDICGYNNSSTTIKLQGSLDIKEARQAAIDELLKECKTSQKE